jgi:hypothetical protein
MGAEQTKVTLVINIGGGIRELPPLSLGGGSGIEGPGNKSGLNETQ